MAIITSGEHNIIICEVVEGEKKKSYANVFLSFIIVHHTPTISISREVPSRIPAVNSEQISDATLGICHLRWRASEETVLENSLPRWLVGSPSPSSVSGDPWSCSCRTLGTWWQEVVLGTHPSALFSQQLCPLPLWPLRQHKALFRRLLMIRNWSLFCLKAQIHRTTRITV